ncbi:SEC-C metal-binding domain-containing protein [Paenibacillus cymbidii]|uniref:SEC-C metal-binding domain-containing protein n=1 Tax=Paenibacillus cymbidii TaxID=1639034 RepID=UPI001081384A|nr:SEC-C metal-binding domain-containing protein [Paenibacillus cymbidii]
MFTREHVKGFILHPESVVCNAALGFFAESFLYENDVTLMPLVLERLRLQPKEARSVHLFHAYCFPQTEETVQGLVELIRSPAVDSNTKFHLFNILIRSDLPLLEPYTTLIEKEREWNKRIQDRIHIASLEDGRLADEFEHFIKDCYGKYIDEFDSFYGDELVRELARRQCIASEGVLHKLDAHDPDDEMGYETIYFAQLAGALKLEAAVPLLCGFLGSEDDLLPSKAVEALVRIGKPSVIAALTERYSPASERDYRLFASDVFGKIKLPESETALLSLLPAEEDFTFATKLADALCELGSEQGFPLVLRMVEEGYDDGYLNLTKSLYAFCVISNTEHPLLPEWRSELEAEERRMAKLDAQSSRMSKGSNRVTGGRQLFGVKAQPHVNTNKVGRNDPCPCGSGKKYKKCCGS